VFKVKYYIEYQDQFRKWRPYQMQYGQTSAWNTASNRTRSTGKRHRLVDEGGRLLDLFEP